MGLLPRPVDLSGNEQNRRGDYHSATEASLSILAKDDSPGLYCSCRAVLGGTAPGVRVEMGVIPDFR